MPTNTLQREVRSVRGRVDHYYMHVESEVTFADLGDAGALHAEHRNRASIARDVKYARRRIQRQHVEVCPDIE